MTDLKLTIWKDSTEHRIAMELRLPPSELKVTEWDGPHTAAWQLTNLETIRQFFKRAEAILGDLPHSSLSEREKELLRIAKEVGRQDVVLTNALINHGNAKPKSPAKPLGKDRQVVKSERSKSPLSNQQLGVAAKYLKLRFCSLTSDDMHRIRQRMILEVPRSIGELMEVVDKVIPQQRKAWESARSDFAESAARAVRFTR